MGDRRQGRGSVLADVEFCRGREELVGGRFGGCMSGALESCSSSQDLEEAEEQNGPSSSGGNDHMARRRRRRAVLDGGDQADSSSARRRRSRILSRWVAWQAEEVITTMERRHRETELMALATRHTVSMINSSIDGESPRGAASGAGDSGVVAERPVAARLSSLVQRWRDLEDYSVGRQRVRPMSNGIRNDSERRTGADRSEGNEYARWSDGPPLRTTRQIVENEEDQGSSVEQSSDHGEGERETVRQIVRGWMAENGDVDPGDRVPSQRNQSPRAEWLGETERERVRIVREWIQMTSQQRDTRLDRRVELAEQDNRSLDGSMPDLDNGLPENIRRDLVRLRGRQARFDLLMRNVMERRRELEGLSEHRAVSNFAHRNRIQSLLRGRFLRHGPPSQEERPPSMADRELGQLRQRHHVSGLREGFRFRLENIVRDQVSTQSTISLGYSANDAINDQPQPHILVETAYEDSELAQPTRENNVTHQTPETEQDEVEINTHSINVDTQEPAAVGGIWTEEVQDSNNRWQQSVEAGFSELNDDTGEESGGNWQNGHPIWVEDGPSSEDVEDGPSSEMHEWHVENTHETIENWEEDIPDPLSERSVPSRSINVFIPPDDDNIYSMELRELLRRRSVSNLLRSGFRESLDRLIQSYIQRQSHINTEWDLEGNLPSHGPEEDQDPQEGELNAGHQDSAVGQPIELMLPPHPPPVPPPAPLWHREMDPADWAQQSLHRAEIECEVINDLKADMAKLRQDMSHLQKMLETCMDMQSELQQSVRQEVSAALNHSNEGKGLKEDLADYGCKWSLVRKGTCCVCCDSQIDSLLYRCGHMCTCAKCATELIRDGGKCPLCRAPIAEMIRAYSVR